MATQGVDFQFDPEKHEFKQNGVVIPSVTQILAKVGVCDFSYVEQEKRVASMKRGSDIHWMLQLEDEGALNYRTVPKRFRGYRKAWQAFKRETGAYVLWIENSFVSKSGYAGIIDRVVSFPPMGPCSSGFNAILDIKTGQVCEWVKFQLVAYAVQYGAMNSMSPSQAVVIRRIAVRLNADGTYRVKEFPRSEFLSDWAVFLDFLRRANDNGSQSGRN